jgi:hypothetical protein
MNVTDLNDAFGLPLDAYVNKRVPKSMLIEKGTPTAADIRQINEGIEALDWVATLKPNTIGIAAYSDETREIPEIVVLHLTLREDAKTKRLNELVHRAIPYPVVLVTVQGTILNLSLVQKQKSQNEASKTIIDGELIETRMDDRINDNFIEFFLKSLTLANQSVKTLFELYEGWIDVVLALQAAHFTGTFTLPTSEEHAAARRGALKECSQLKAQMTSLRATATKETQLARQVELNLKLERLRVDYAAKCTRL